MLSFTEQLGLYTI